MYGTSRWKRSTIRRVKSDRRTLLCEEQTKDPTMDGGTQRLRGDKSFEAQIAVMMVTDAVHVTTIFFFRENPRSGRRRSVETVITVHINGVYPTSVLGAQNKNKMSLSRRNAQTGQMLWVRSGASDKEAATINRRPADVGSGRQENGNLLNQ